MTIRKKPNAVTIQQQAQDWLKAYSQSVEFDIYHPATQAIYNLAICGSLSNKDNSALNGLFLRMQEKALRGGGKTHEEALEILATENFISTATIKRLIKSKVEMPSEISELMGQQLLFKFLFVVCV